jgi:hypothetical protein
MLVLPLQDQAGVLRIRELLVASTVKTDFFTVEEMKRGK